MGYRGNVKIKCEKKDFKYFEEAFKNNLEKNNEPFYPDYFKEDGDAFIFGWDDIKWYDGFYDEVTNIMDVVRKLATEADEFSYIYVGEGADSYCEVEEMSGTYGSDLYVDYQIKGDENSKDVTPPWEK